MHYFEKMSSVSGASPPDPTGELPPDPAGGLPSFRPPHCPRLEKNPAGAHGCIVSNVVLGFGLVFLRFITDKI